jgi:homoserine O-acetyltransferase
MADTEVFALGDCTLQHGGAIPNAKIVFKTHGTLNPAHDNAILFPTHYGGTHVNNEWLIGPGKALDTDRWFVIVPNMLGNGVSSSPSNVEPPHGGANFPHVTVYDNVALQHRLLVERFAVTHLQLVIGFSMGAQQSFQWAVSYPDMVERCIPICGSARTAPHNFVFLEGEIGALRSDPAWNNGNYTEQPIAGMRLMGRVWAGWGASQTFYREHLYKQQGFTSIEDYIVRGWEDGFAQGDANDLLAMAWTWQHADVGATPGMDGSFEKALRSIKARTIVMPCATDLYFPPEDSAIEVQHIPHAELRTIPSVWGHQAGGGGEPATAAFIDAAVRQSLAG